MKKCYVYLVLTLLGILGLAGCGKKPVESLSDVKDMVAENLESPSVYDACWDNYGDNVSYTWGVTMDLSVDTNQVTDKDASYENLDFQIVQSTKVDEYNNIQQIIIDTKSNIVGDVQDATELVWRDLATNTIYFKDANNQWCCDTKNTLNTQIYDLRRNFYDIFKLASASDSVGDDGTNYIFDVSYGENIQKLLEATTSNEVVLTDYSHAIAQVYVNKETGNIVSVKVDLTDALIDYVQKKYGDAYTVDNITYTITNISSVLTELTIPDEVKNSSATYIVSENDKSVESVSTEESAEVVTESSEEEVIDESPNENTYVITEYSTISQRVNNGESFKVDSLIAKYGLLKPEETNSRADAYAIYAKMISICNNYTPNELLQYLDYWNFMEEYDRCAIVKLAQMEIIDFNIETLNTYIKDTNKYYLEAVALNDATFNIGASESNTSASATDLMVVKDINAINTTETSDTANVVQE